MYVVPIYFYLLHLVILGGCNHVRHDTFLHNFLQSMGQCVASPAGNKSVIGKFTRVLHVKKPSQQDHSLQEKKEQMVEDLMNYAQYISMQNKDHAANAVKVFRKAMEHIVAHYCHPNNNLICRWISSVAVYNFHRAIQIILLNNIPDAVILSLLQHVDAHTKHQPNKAKMYADAIAGTAINAVGYILLSSLQGKDVC